MTQLSSEQINQLLNENARLIKVIIACQNDGQITDAVLYQTRLQLNLIQLATVADNHPHPSASGTIRMLNNAAQRTTDRAHLSMELFVNAVTKYGLRDLARITEETEISPEKIVPLAFAYIDFLRRKNRIAEASKLQNELEIQGIYPN